jgi:ABC-type transport system involved in Fe-S cluster assembly fused permease/ATPase subunit
LLSLGFLKDAPIILLDEPTSALDSETESHQRAESDEGKDYGRDCASAIAIFMPT